MQADFNTLLRQRLAAPVKDKQGNILLNQDTGSYMTALDAMVMSVVNNAMKGDIGSIAFIRNITRNEQSVEDEEFARKREERTEKMRLQLKKQLDDEGFYDGQDFEISMLADTAILIEELNEQMQSPDFSPTISEYTSTGNTKTVINPILTMRDQQQDKFRQQIDKIRKDAKERITARKLKKIR